MSTVRAIGFMRKRFSMRLVKSHVVNEVDKEFLEFKRKQQRFQIKDGVPVFLKGGGSDKVLFFATAALAGLGLVGTFEFIYIMAFPIIKKESEDQLGANK